MTTNGPIHLRRHIKDVLAAAAHTPDARHNARLLARADNPPSDAFYLDLWRSYELERERALLSESHLSAEIAQIRDDVATLRRDLVILSHLCEQRHSQTLAALAQPEGYRTPMERVANINETIAGLSKVRDEAEHESLSYIAAKLQATVLEGMETYMDRVDARLGVFETRLSEGIRAPASKEVG